MTVRIVALSGFLGAGKTTTMATIGRALEAAGERVALITNDQGDDLVDSRTVEWATSTTDEVTGGCFCCRFEDLAAIIDRITDERSVTVVVMEAVGSCTDLHATVIRPLRLLHGRHVSVAPLVTVVDPARYGELATASGDEPASDLAYLFDRQLAEADIIALNKIDELDATSTSSLRQKLEAHWPAALVVAYSARTGNGLPELLTAMEQDPPDRDVSVDYDRYAAAEAALAWLNQTVDLVPAAGQDGLLSATWAMTLLDSISRQCLSGQHLVGHVKVRLDTTSGSVTANLVGRGSPSLTTEVTGRAPSAIALVNARIVSTPEQLDKMVRTALVEADAAACATSSATTDPVAFSPSYPKPVHRLPKA